MAERIGLDSPSRAYRLRRGYPSPLATICLRNMLAKSAPYRTYAVLVHLMFAHHFLIKKMAERIGLEPMDRYNTVTD